MRSKLLGIRPKEIKNKSVYLNNISLDPQTCSPISSSWDTVQEKQQAFGQPIVFRAGVHAEFSSCSDTLENFNMISPF